MQKNHLGRDGVRALLHAIGGNPKVILTHFVKCGLDDASVEEVATFLRRNQTLQILMLHGAPVVGANASVFVEGLARNHSLATLDLTGCAVHATQVKLIAQALTRNRELLALTLDQNDLGDEGIQALVDGLAEQTTLTTLNVRGNGFTFGGALALASYLNTSETLIELGISNNLIGEDGFDALGQALSVNRVLTRLEAFGCEATGAMVTRLLEQLQPNRSLTVLDLRATNFDDVDALAAAVGDKLNLQLRLDAGLMGNAELTEKMDAVQRVRVDLDKAILAKDKNAIRTILEKGAPGPVEGHGSWVHYAAAKGSLEGVECLLEFPSQIPWAQAKNRVFETASDVARANGHKKMTVLIDRMWRNQTRCFTIAAEVAAMAVVTIWKFHREGTPFALITRDEAICIAKEVWKSRFCDEWYSALLKLDDAAKAGK